mmetsp:Transcript_68718/g.183077  ORF Transcript_68718/g.183077 Transcript_68718/m.183077 type:complete len:208 (-) Transcript_68718:1170-1793(-)
MIRIVLVASCQGNKSAVQHGKIHSQHRRRMFHKALRSHSENLRWRILLRPGQRVELPRPQRVQEKTVWPRQRTILRGLVNGPHVRRVESAETDSANPSGDPLVASQRHCSALRPTSALAGRARRHDSIGANPTTTLLRAIGYRLSSFGCTRDEPREVPRAGPARDFHRPRSFWQFRSIATSATCKGRPCGIRGLVTPMRGSLRTRGA